jgi:cytoskeletal protein RodZ
MNDNFRELLGLVVALLLYLGMLWFVLLKQQNVPEVAGTEVAQAQEHDRQTEGSPKPSKSK